MGQVWPGLPANRRRPVSLRFLVPLKWWAGNAECLTALALKQPQITHLGERYELKSQAGAGGMGTVFQAYDRRTREVVAVKVLHGKGDTDAARFEREAQLLADLQHPAIVRFIDYGTTTHGEPYYVMEWLQGETVDERLSRGPMAPSLVARLGARVLAALSAAHEKGVIHRDIKPSNIFLANFRVADAKLIDFGVARKTDDAFRLTKRGNTVGTPMYNAPEQARGKGDLDGRVDVFALGCVLFEALTCEPAFVGDSPGQVMTRIASGQGPDLQRRMPVLDPELRSTLAAMLAHNRDDRPADPVALSAKLGAIAERLLPKEGQAPTPHVSAVAPKRGAQEALSQNEQRVMTLLVLARFTKSAERVAAASHAPVMASALGEDLVGRLVHLLEPFGGRVDRLLDRSVIVTAPALPSVLEQAEQIGRMGLAVVARHPELTIAMATGRAVLLARLPAGEVIEQAAVLLEGASPGVVVMDDTSARLVAGNFGVLHERSQHVLLQERDGGLTPRRILGEVTPYSGRERELAALVGLLAECVADDVSRAAVLVAPAGMGKSRLLAEWVRRMKVTAEDVLVLRSRAIPLNVPEPYQSVLGFFTQSGVNAATPEASEALGDWLEAKCKKQTVIAILEDAHLADTSSLQLIDSLLGRLQNVPFMVVVSGRPELTERMPDLFESRSPLHMRLAPWARRHAEHALRGLLPTSTPEVDEWIFSRARGNPFCLEELARHSLLPGRALLPETVLGLVHAELDGLGGDGKRVLRACSVFGMSFLSKGVAALLGEGSLPLLDEMLNGLALRGYLERTPNNVEGEWRFVEPVIREVAYDTLGGSDRILARRLARAFLNKAGQPIPTPLSPGESRGEVTPSQLPALSFLARR